ncbi:site-2 protease family protein [Pseudoflavonifractor sp. An85]|uniref:site-2 protease family protein n=1 Tax=Pseudoflavonifractor sp. An85 TaxID=1965661 RepID=UPI000B3A1DFC|nr:site-2 protease family protein [Pseudoflavonifractor sp. An85]OUN25038.1 hypothetical protein B5G37_05105 [Pseudoflavonifractor sp. An85]
MWTHPEVKWKVSPGFWLVLGVLYYLDEGTGLLPWGLLACLVHEVGHWLAAKWYGGQLETVQLTAVGAEMVLCYPRTLSYGEDTVVALAGPVANALLSGVAWGLRIPVLAALSVGLGAFNLLPIFPLDGARVLHNYLCPLLGPQRAERWGLVASACLVGGLLGLGAILVGEYANLTLLLTSAWLFWGIVRKQTLGWWREKKEKTKK